MAYFIHLLILLSTSDIMQQRHNIITFVHLTPTHCSHRIANSRQTHCMFHTPGCRREKIGTRDMQKEGEEARHHCISHLKSGYTMCLSVDCSYEVRGPFMTSVYCHSVTWHMYRKAQLYLPFKLFEQVIYTTISNSFFLLWKHGPWYICIRQ